MTTLLTPSTERCAPTGSGAVRRGTGNDGSTKLLLVQVQASACLDEVAFSFSPEVPAWRATTRGTTVVLAFDDVAETPPEFEEVPDVTRPLSPSGIRDVRRDRDGWVVDLGDVRPFEVITRASQVVVRSAASVPRTTRCGLPATEGAPPLTIGYPADWFTELGAPWQCQRFHHEPFLIEVGTDHETWTASVDVAQDDADTTLGHYRSGSDVTTVGERTVAGLRAVVVDLKDRGDGLYPAGFESRAVVIDAGHRAVVISSTPRPAGATAEAGRAAVDDLTRRIEPKK